MCGDFMRKLTGSSPILLTFVMCVAGCEKTPPEVIRNYSSTSAFSSAESASQNTQHYQFGKNNNSMMVYFGFDSSTMSRDATQELKKATRQLQSNPSKSIVQNNWAKGDDHGFF